MTEFTASNGTQVRSVQGSNTYPWQVGGATLKHAEFEALREFFRNESMPWHSAKPGEVWEFTIDSGWTHAAFLRDDGKWRWTRGGFVGIDDVESARRIYPEAV